MNFAVSAFNNTGSTVALPQPLAFSLSADWTGINTSLTVRFAGAIPQEAVRLTAAIDGQQIFAGFVNSIKRTLDKNGDASFITAMGDYAKLKQNQVLPKDWSLFDSSELMSNYGTPYGLTASELPAAVMTTLAVRTGMTAWDTIKLFCRSCYNQLPQVDDQGVLSTISLVRTQVVFGQGGIPYRSLSYVDDRSALLSRVYMQSSGSEFAYDVYTDNPYATQCGIVRERYCKTPDPWKSLPKLGANEVVRNSNAKHYTYEIVVADQVDVHVRDVVRIQGHDIQETNFYVHEKVFTFDENGPQTKLTLRSLMMM